MSQVRLELAERSYGVLPAQEHPKSLGLDGLVRLVSPGEFVAPQLNDDHDVGEAHRRERGSAPQYGVFAYSAWRCCAGRLNRRELLPRGSTTEPTMAVPSLDPPVADEAPTSAVLTAYDHEHMVTYLRLLDAEAGDADWTEVARTVLHIDPGRQPERAWRAWESHLSRAKWMTEHGYWHLLRGSAPN